ncbi:MAG: hypothetical protein ABI277_03275 [Burkholderiaceae bacterium]
MLGDEGLLFIFEHNPLNPFKVSVIKQCPFDINARLLDARTLKRRVTEAGLVDASIRYRLFVPPVMRRLRFIERPLRWLPLCAQYYVGARKRGT